MLLTARTTARLSEAVDEQSGNEAPMYVPHASRCISLSGFLRCAFVGEWPALKLSRYGDVQSIGANRHDPITPRQPRISARTKVLPLRRGFARAMAPQPVVNGEEHDTPHEDGRG